MQGLTIYRFPKKSLSPKKPTSKAARLWKKHRQMRAKSTRLPKLKN